MKKKDRLEGKDYSALKAVQETLAGEDEYSEFGPICSEMCLAHSHAGVLAVMDRDTALDWEEKIWSYLRYVCILGAKATKTTGDEAPVITLCRTPISKNPKDTFEQQFIADFRKSEHQKAEGIYIASRNPWGKVFSMPTEEIKIMRATYILIEFPKEVQPICRTIMLSFIYRGEAQPTHIRDFQIMHNVQARTNLRESA